MSGAEDTSPARLDALLERINEATGGMADAEFVALMRQGYAVNPGMIIGLLADMLDPTKREALFMQGLTNMVAEFMAKDALPRTDQVGDGLDHVECDGVRLPRMLTVDNGKAVFPQHATVADLRVAARIAQADPANRDHAKAWLALADRMVAAGAGLDDTLLAAAGRLA
ncbi:hypothetical protein J5Y09_18770 [Roseomonas sp. PWR1]|uniref:Thymidine phosphorylase n=1 Tax=Roseomonas nitratireducens TaxID=2820810 RepID=A0ABS4AX80_9PROT|nr:hypothetical protein [Neoroseomonas nitratireducens]MBP0465977.1 hypothetical protein [Neoroseomonas nitratireducens]